MEIQQQTKKPIREMSATERRQYDKLQKRDQRARQKADQEEKRIKTFGEYKLSQEKQALLDEHAAEVLALVKSEISDYTLTYCDESTVRLIADVMFGFENNIVQKVQGFTPELQEYQMAVGGRLPDAVGSLAVEHVHRYPQLLKSETFKELYDKALRSVVKLDGKFQHAYSNELSMAQIKQAIAGVYQPISETKIAHPAVPEPQPPTAPVEVSKPAPGANIERNPPQWHGVSADAMRYLDGQK